MLHYYNYLFSHLNLYDSPEENKVDSLNLIKGELSDFKTEENPSEVVDNYNFIAMLYFDFGYKPEEIIKKVEKDLAEIKI